MLKALNVTPCIFRSILQPTARLFHSIAKLQELGNQAGFTIHLRIIQVEGDGFMELQPLPPIANAHQSIDFIG